LRGSRDFRSIVFASALSAFGDELALIALTIRVANLTDSGLAVSVVLMAGLVPIVLLAPLAGYVVDRVENRRALMLASLLQAAAALALATTQSIPTLVVLSFVLGVGASVAEPATWSLVPVIVGESRVGKANGTLSSARYVGAVLGPIAAGLLAEALGTGTALAIDAATFVAIAFAALLLRARREPVGDEGKGRDRGVLTAGFRAIGRDALLRVGVVVVAAAIVFAGMDNVAEVFFARDVLDAGSLGYGVLATAWMLGMVGGASLIGGRLPSPRLAPSIVTSAILGGAAVAAAALIGSYPVAIILFCVGGVANGVMNVAMRSLIFERASERIRGRVFAAYGGLANGMQIAATAGGGVVVTVIGAQAALVLGGLGSVTIGIAGAIWLATVPSSARVGRAVTPSA
jgi:MFS family permease